jgi:hypothetical protein
MCLALILRACRSLQSSYIRKAWSTRGALTLGMEFVGVDGTVRSAADFEAAAIGHDQSDQTVADLDVKVEPGLDRRFICIAHSRLQEAIISVRAKHPHEGINFAFFAIHKRCGLPPLLSFCLL